MLLVDMAQPESMVAVTRRGDAVTGRGDAVTGRGRGCTEPVVTVTTTSRLSIVWGICITVLLVHNIVRWREEVGKMG